MIFMIFWITNQLSINIKRGGGINYILGNENAIIWSWQRRLRKTEYYFNTGKKIRYYLSKALLNWKSNKYGLHIGLNTFDKGLHVMHLGPILVNEKVRVGKDCAIHINTSLVAQGVSSDTPILGNNIVIGVGATVLGGITLADGIAVGANALVNKSFLESDIAIAGVPAKKISNNGKKNWNK